MQAFNESQRFTMVLSYLKDDANIGADVICNHVIVKIYLRNRFRNTSTILS